MLRFDFSKIFLFFFFRAIDRAEKLKGLIIVDNLFSGGKILTNWIARSRSKIPLFGYFSCDYSPEDKCYIKRTILF